jgi:ATP-dependent protease HslVU (ClpYQ) peptidase subunit
MTVIVAVKDGNVILMGCDSAATDEMRSKQIRRDKKIFTKMCGNEEMLIGFSGEYRIPQRIQYEFTAPVYDYSYDDAMSYLVSAFLPALEEFFNYDKCFLGECELLIGFDKQIFKIYSDGQVSQALTDYDALGDIALGALHAGWSLGSRSHELIDVALHACEELMSTVAKPFHIEYLMSNTNQPKTKKRKHVRL